MNDETPPDGTPLPPALKLLLGRYSLGLKHLDAPAPDAGQLALMVQAALRAPDHGGLVPFRFVIVTGPARETLADLFERVAIESGKPPEARALDRERALRAPLSVAVIARLDPGHPLAPVHEQWMAVGGAVANFLTAAHALGFAGKILSGAKVRAPAVIAAFCAPGETLVGWIGLGTARRAVSPRQGKPAPETLLSFWPPRPPDGTPQQE
jgi:nitroreductase